jgi:hypothetical protein
MSAQFESFLANIYVNETARSRFLENPRAAAVAAGLSAAETEAVLNIDQVGLQMTVDSLIKKKGKRHVHTPRWRLLLRNWFSR